MGGLFGLLILSVIIAVATDGRSTAVPSPINRSTLEPIDGTAKPVEASYDIAHILGGDIPTPHPSTIVAEVMHAYARTNPPPIPELLPDINDIPMPRQPGPLETKYRWRVFVKAEYIGLSWDIPPDSEGFAIVVDSTATQLEVMALAKFKLVEYNQGIPWESESNLLKGEGLRIIDFYDSYTAVGAIARCPYAHDLPGAEGIERLIHCPNALKASQRHRVARATLDRQNGHLEFQALAPPGSKFYEDSPFPLGMDTRDRRDAYDKEQRGWDDLGGCSWGNLGSAQVVVVPPSMPRKLVLDRGKEAILEMWSGSGLLHFLAIFNSEFTGYSSCKADLLENQDLLGLPPDYNGPAPVFTGINVPTKEHLVATMVRYPGYRSTPTVVITWEQEPQECLAWVWPSPGQPKIMDHQLGFQTFSLEYPDCNPESLNQIGVQIGLLESKLMINAVRPGSHAEMSGIQAGDQILAIDGESTANMSLSTAGGRIRGKEGTTGGLLLLRPNQSAPLTLMVKRGVIPK